MGKAKLITFSSSEDDIEVYYRYDGVYPSTFMQNAPKIFEDTEDDKATNTQASSIFGSKKLCSRTAPPYPKMRTFAGSIPIETKSS